MNEDCLRTDIHYPFHSKLSPNHQQKEKFLWHNFQNHRKNIVTSGGVVEELLCRTRIRFENSGIRKIKKTITEEIAPLFILRLPCLKVAEVE